MKHQTIYNLPQIHYFKLRFQLVAMQNTQLGINKGSMLRGAFGHSFRRVVCVAGPKQECVTCILKQKCSYKQVFEPDVKENPPPFLRGLPTAPRPYIFDCTDTKQAFRKNDRLSFDFTLIGTTTEYLPYVILVVTEMAEKGLGTHRTPFKLQKVFCKNSDSKNAWIEIYDSLEGKIKDIPSPRFALPGTSQDNDTIINRLTLHFQTPARLQFNNGFKQNFTFRLLVFKILRRMLELAHFYAPEETINWEFNEYLVSADKVEIVANNLHWQDWTRRSNRQNTTMHMGGYTGTLELAGELAPFMDLLRMGEVLHIGKGTVFGNGKMRVLNDEFF